MALRLERMVSTMHGAKDLYLRWNVSLATVRRKMKSGQIRTVKFGARRLVPIDEVLRIDREGIGK
jgi:hypothetical protein